MSESSSNIEKKVSNKDIILETAYALFLKKGFKSVSIKDIMEDSEISKGGVYHHFESKEAILFAVLDQYFFKALSIDPSAFEGLTFKERIHKVYHLGTGLFAMVETMGKKGIAYPIQRLFQFQLECENFPEMRRQFGETSSAYKSFVKNIVEEGIRNQEVKKELDADTLSYQIIGMIEGIAVHHSTVKKDVGALLIEKYNKVFESYFKFICTE